MSFAEDIEIMQFVKTGSKTQNIFDRGMIKALSLREILRLKSDTVRWVSLLAQPILFWLILGKVFGSDWNVGGVSYSQYFFPGTLLMVILFTSVGATMSLIEDRQSGFFQSVLIAPGKKQSIVLGKVLGITIITLLQVAVVMLLASYAGFSTNKLFSPLFLLAVILNCVTLASMGFSLAWLVKSMQAYHSVMSIVFLPLWVLSGAIYPVKGAIIETFNIFNPMSYGVTVLRASLNGGIFPLFPWISFFSLVVAALFFISLATLLCYRIRRTIHE